jgi:hypothetical protein
MASNMVPLIAHAFWSCAIDWVREAISQEFEVKVDCESVYQGELTGVLGECLCSELPQINGLSWVF